MIWFNLTHDIVGNIQSISTAQSPETFQITNDVLADPITCVCISDKYLVVGRESGMLMRLVLPHLSLENTYTSQTIPRPVRLALNCTSSRVAVIDETGMMIIMDLEAKTEGHAAGRVSFIPTYLYC